MATAKFEMPDFQFSGGKLAPGCSCVMRLTDDNGAVQKWRCTLTINDDGTWQWAPGPPAGVKVPLDVSNSISASVAGMVKKYGVDRSNKLG